MQPLCDYTPLKSEEAGKVPQMQERLSDLIERSIQALQGNKSENTGDEVCSLLSGKPQEVEPSKSRWSEVRAVGLD